MSLKSQTHKAPILESQYYAVYRIGQPSYFLLNTQLRVIELPEVPYTLQIRLKKGKNGKAEKESERPNFPQANPITDSASGALFNLKSVHSHTVMLLIANGFSIDLS